MSIWVNGREYHRAFVGPGGKGTGVAYWNGEKVLGERVKSTKINDAFNYATGTWIDTLPIYAGNGSYPRNGNGVWYRDSPNGNRDGCAIWPSAMSTSPYQIVEATYVVPSLYSTENGVGASLRLAETTTNKSLNSGAWIGFQIYNNKIITVASHENPSDIDVSTPVNSVPVLRIEKDRTRYRLYVNRGLVREGDLPPAIRDRPCVPTQTSSSYRTAGGFAGIGAGQHRGAVEWSSFYVEEHN